MSLWQTAWDNYLHDLVISQFAGHLQTLDITGVLKVL